MKKLLLASILVICACASDQLTNSGPSRMDGTPEGQIQMTWVCMEGGDSFAYPATWDLTQCGDVESFDSQAFSTRVSMGPSGFGLPPLEDPSKYRSTSFVLAEYHYFDGTITYGEGTTAFLRPSVRAVRFVGYVGYCLKEIEGYQLSDVDCERWAFDNSGFQHDEAYLCVGNPNVVSLEYACGGLMVSGNLAQLPDPFTSPPIASAAIVLKACGPGCGVLERVELDGSGSQGTGPLTYRWSFESTSIFESLGSRLPYGGWLFTTPSGLTSPTPVLFELTVTDRLGRSSTVLTTVSY